MLRLAGYYCPAAQRELDFVVRYGRLGLVFLDCESARAHGSTRDALLRTTGQIALVMKVAKKSVIRLRRSLLYSHPERAW